MPCITHVPSTPRTKSLNLNSENYVLDRNQNKQLLFFKFRSQTYSTQRTPTVSLEYPESGQSIDESGHTMNATGGNAVGSNSMALIAR